MNRKTLVENSGYNANHSRFALGLYKMSFEWVSWSLQTRRVAAGAVVLELGVTGGLESFRAQDQPQSESENQV